VATTVAQAVSVGFVPPAEVERDSTSRPTPIRLRLIAGGLVVAVLALLAATAASFFEARARAETVTSRARTAVQAGDLYFALADLDAEAARLVLLGDGDLTPGDGAYSGNQLSALIAYNTRTAQVGADLQALAADGAASTSIATQVTSYRSIADAAIGLDQYPGAAAGQSAPTAIGFYGRAETLMHGVVLPAAAQLRDETAAASTQAASNARTWAIAGFVATLVLGVVAILALVTAQRRFNVLFRRRLNASLLTATVITIGLIGGSALALGATARDAGAAGSRLSTYLQVVRTRADSYDADGTTVRSVLMPDAFGRTQLAAQEQTVDSDLAKLDGTAGNASALWSKGPVSNYGAILTAVAGGDIARALTVETGTARGQDAFDFFDYDQTLQAVDTQRLASFQSASDGLSSDVGPWLLWPWILAGAVLLLIGVAVRPRLAEYH
jgi:CHASE3 domain sensor protein